MRATQVNTREDPARDRPPSGALGAQAPIVVLEPDAAMYFHCDCQRLLKEFLASSKTVKPNE